MRALYEMLLSCTEIMAAVLGSLPSYLLYLIQNISRNELAGSVEEEKSFQKVHGSHNQIFLSPCYNTAGASSFLRKTSLLLIVPTIVCTAGGAVLGHSKIIFLIVIVDDGSGWLEVADGNVLFHQETKALDVLGEQLKVHIDFIGLNLCSFNEVVEPGQLFDRRFYRNVP